MSPQLSHSEHADTRPRWMSPYLPASRAARPAPPSALPGLPRRAVSVRRPHVAPGTLLARSPPSDTPRSADRAAELKPSALCAASLCAPVILAVTSVPPGLALRHTQSTADERGTRTGLATPGHRVGTPGCSARGRERRIATQAFALNASIGRSY